MKKYILFAVFTFTVVSQTFYILHLKQELLINRKYTMDQIKALLGESVISYTNNVDYIGHSEGLSEPASLSSNSDIIGRMEMLDMHLNESSRPSIKWLKDVNDAAMREIIYLRDHVKVGDFSHHNIYCPRGNMFMSR